MTDPISLAADSPDKSRSVLVVILNWNGIRDTLNALDSLRAQDFDPFDVLVVDNASSDDSLQQLAPRVESGEIILIENSRNLGFSGGVNTGIRFAMDRGYGAVALLNNDAIPAPDWLSRISNKLFDSDASIVTGLILDSTGVLIDSSGDFYSRWGMPYPRDRDRGAECAPPSGFVFGASGGASIYRTALFKDIGLFDEKYFAYFEDVDLSFRAQLRGHRVFYVREARVFHQRGASSSTIPGFTVYQNFKNLPLVFWRNVPISVVPRVAPRFALVYCAIFVNAIRKGRGGPAFRGAAKGIVLTATHALTSRGRIQRSRRISGTALYALLTDASPLRVNRESSAAER